MAMVNLALAKDQNMGTDMVVQPSAPAYPYGLSITLDKDTLQKVGLTADGVPVGKVFEVDAKVLVTAVSKEPTGAGETVTLQITDLDMQDRDDYEGAFKEAVGAPEEMGDPWL